MPPRNIEHESSRCDRIHREPTDHVGQSLQLRVFGCAALLAFKTSLAATRWTTTTPWVVPPQYRPTNLHKVHCHELAFVNQIRLSASADSLIGMPETRTAEAHIPQPRIEASNVSSLRPRAAHTPVALDRCSAASTVANDDGTLAKRSGSTKPPSNGDRERATCRRLRSAPMYTTERAPCANAAAGNGAARAAKRSILRAERDKSYWILRDDEIVACERASARRNERVLRDSCKGTVRHVG